MRQFFQSSSLLQKFVSGKSVLGKLVPGRAASNVASIAKRWPTRNLLAIGGLLVLCVFGGTAILAQTSAQSNTAASDEQAQALPDPLQVELATSMGSIVLQLNPQLAPFSVQNFLQYVQSDFYTETIFHRVIEGFMIQGGGFTTTYQKKFTKPPVQNEANNGLKNRKYTIAMARTSAPHSATAQFFINAADNDYLDYRDSTTRGWGYAVFGEVVQGKDIVDAISQVQTGAGGPFSRDAPAEQIIINSVQILYPEEPEAAQAQAGEDSNAEGESSTQEAKTE